MADEELSAEEQQPKKKKGMLKWIILVVLLLGLGGGGYFAYTKFFAAGGDEAAQQEQAAEQADEQPGQVEDGIIVTLPTFVVNLADPLGRRYLKLGLDVEVRDEEAQTELEMNQPKVKDKLLLLLSSKTYQDLASLQSKLELKEEIVQRINQVIGKNKVLNVYITEMVIQ